MEVARDVGELEAVHRGSDRMIVSSVAAAWSSKLNERQKRLRNASPQARLIRLPKGEWMTNCMPPVSSKKRSKMSVSRVGRRAERGAAGAEIAHQLDRGGGLDADFVDQPGQGRCQGVG